MCNMPNPGGTRNVVLHRGTPTQTCVRVTHKTVLLGPLGGICGGPTVHGPACLYHSYTVRSKPGTNSLARLTGNANIHSHGTAIQVLPLTAAQLAAQLANAYTA